MRATVDLVRDHDWREFLGEGARAKAGSYSGEASRAAFARVLDA